MGPISERNNEADVAPDLESILRARRRKIVLQHNLPKTGLMHRSKK
jgi:hypothetical protein